MDERCFIRSCGESFPSRSPRCAISAETVFKKPAAPRHAVTGVIMPMITPAIVGWMPAA